MFTTYRGKLLNISTIQNGSLLDRVLAVYDQGCQQFGRWLIATFAPHSTDSWCLLALKITAIFAGSLFCLILALPTIGLSIAFPAYSLWRGAEMEQTMLSERPSEQRVGAPIGIQNSGKSSGNNCFFSTALQLFLNTPSLLNMMVKAGEERREYRELVRDYQICQKNNRSMESGEGSACYNFRNYLINKGLVVPQCEQGDAAKAINAILKDLVKNYKISSPLFRKSLLMNENKIIEVVEESLQTVYAESDKIDLGAGLKKQMEVDKGSYIFEQPPSSFLFSLNKMGESSHDFLKFTLPKELSQDQQEANYACTFIAVHQGSLSGGHYISYVKVNGIWYKMNMEYREEVSEKSVSDFAKALSLEEWIMAAYFERTQYTEGVSKIGFSALSAP
jgi:hypothetical protein